MSINDFNSKNLDKLVDEYSRVYLKYKNIRSHCAGVHI